MTRSTIPFCTGKVELFLASWTDEAQKCTTRLVAEQVENGGRKA
jgi:hypothetical protein